MTTPELRLPVGYDELMSDNDWAVHESLAARSLQEFINFMPEPTEVELSDGRHIRAIDYRGSNEGSSDKATVMPLPFGNPYSPAMHIRTQALSEFTGGEKRVIVFPNNSTSEQYYELSGDHDKDAINDLAEQQSEAIARLGIEEADISGYSQGALVGSSMLAGLVYKGDFGVSSAMLGDAPYEPGRNPDGLESDFKKTGLGNLNQAVNDSGIAALSETQNSRGGFDHVRQAIGLVGLLRSSLRPDNKALQQAMAEPYRMTKDLSEARCLGLGESIVVARMAASRICSPEIETDLLYAGSTASVETVRSYGHEGGDNVVWLALATRKAMQAA